MGRAVKKLGLEFDHLKITLNRLDIILRNLLTVCGQFSAHYLSQEGSSVRGSSPIAEILWLLVSCQRQKRM